MKKQILIAVFIIIGWGASAQTGFLKGVLYDGELNDVLPFANIIVDGSTKGATTDFEGKYTLELEPGIYQVNFSFVGYQSKKITDIVINANQETIVNVTLESAASNLEEVVITTSARRNSEQAVLNLQKKSINTFDGLSLEAVKKTGASNVASAVKSVPGVSIQSGKFVYVRGLGDRYTKSTLNGIDVPGLDPDKNNVQLDIFPTSLIENIKVFKTLTADLPADFTGGVVDIVTKDFSSREQYNISVGVGLNPSMHFNDDYISQQSSGTDFLGLDDGLRDDPIARGVAIPQPFENDPRLTEFTQRFNPQLAAQDDTSFMNYNFGFSTSNQFDVGDNKLGYVGSLTYRSETTFYDDFTQNFLFKPQSLSENELVPNRLQRGNLAEQSNLISALAGLTFKTDQSKYKLLATRIQEGVSKTGEFRQESFITNAAIFFSDNLEFTERNLTNVLLTGKHSFQKNQNWELEWKVSGTSVNVNDKDVRSTLFEFDDGRYIIRPSIGEPRRIWRELAENGLSSKLDIDKKHSLFDRPANLKFGLNQTYKQRDFSINQYTLRLNGVPALSANGEPDRLLLDENLWRTDNDGGVYIFSNFEPANTFESYSTNYAAFVSEEFQLTEKLKSIVGLRFEKFDLFYTGQNTLREKLTNANLVNQADLFPSVNLIYSFNEDSNFRTSYARSTARPSFKEASNAQIFDPITNITFNGNINIKPTYIDNFDLRYEAYSEDGGLIALSGFYKRFIDPIELTIFGLKAINDVTPRNIGDANVYGLELEFRRNLALIAPGLSNFSLNTNISIIQSEQTMSQQEFDGRQSAARDGEVVDNKRQLQGQSPYLINAGLTYQNDDLGVQSGLYYNVQGKTLQIVGIGQVSDVFSDPFHSLNFNISKSFGNNSNQTIRLSIDNLMDDEVRSYYESFAARDQIFSNFSPGRELSVKYSYKF